MHVHRCLFGLILISLGIAASHGDEQSNVGRRLCEQAGIPYRAVIAHRGASHHAPESTRPAYELAIELGADYLEVDLQRTKDGQLVVFHDDDLSAKSDIGAVYPDRANEPMSQFTFAELRVLDVGSWFNRKFPERARPSFRGLQILKLGDVLDIIDKGKNKPGIYIETKVPQRFPGIERDLADELKSRGWLDDSLRAATDFRHDKYVGVAYTRGRVVLQTFEKDSLRLLHEHMPDVPKCLLLWLDDGHIASKTPKATRLPDETKAAFYARKEVLSQAEFEKWLDFAVQSGAAGTGPSCRLADLGSQSYSDLAQPWMNELAHRKGLFVHAYTVDDRIDMDRYSKAGVDGFFTNRCDVLLDFYGRKPRESVSDILLRIGY
jgi:glycerophosphoryl diester phosphodiesterase